METPKIKRYAGSFEIKQNSVTLTVLQEKITEFVVKNKLATTPGLEIYIVPEGYCDDYSDNHYLTININRDETVEEQKARLKVEEERAKQRAEAQQKANERAEKERKALYLKLKKEYESK